MILSTVMGSVLCVTDVEVHVENVGFCGFGEQIYLFSIPYTMNLAGESGYKLFIFVLNGAC